MSTQRRPGKGSPTAWDVLQAPDPRPMYVVSPDRARELRRRARFRQQVTRDRATGCWLWSGSVSKGKPVFSIRRHLHSEGSTTRSAFVWMLEQWFPLINFPDKSRGTVTTCGQDLCISPHHRQRKGYEHVAKLTPGQIRSIHDRKGSASAQQVAQEHGIRRKTVWEIWSGRRHREVTGVLRTEPVTRKLTADQARAIYARKGKGQTQQQVADEFGVSRGVVSQIWSGRMWSDATGAERSCRPVKAHDNLVAPTTR